MEWLTQLWLPIIVSAVGVYIASTIIWTISGFHKGDFKQLPDEETLLAAMRRHNVRPGQFMFPYCDHSKKSAADMEEVKRKYTEGPVGLMTIRPSGCPAMGATLVQWFIYCLILSALVGYIAWHSLGASIGMDFWPVVRIVAAVSILAYGAAKLPDAIWWGKPWPNVARDIVDSIIYGAITGSVFAWLWPAAETILNNPPSATESG